MPHLVFYSPEALPTIGGLQYVVHYWATELALRGHTVTILTDTPDGESGWRKPPMPQRMVYARRLSRWQQYRFMRQADRVVMFNISLKGLPLWLFARLTGGPALYATHHTALWYENGPRPLRQRLKQWVANRLAKANCACSGYIAAFYRNCQVIYSPIQLQLFNAPALPNRTGSLIFVGRHVSDKGADLLIAALGLLHKQGQLISLTLVGSGPDTATLRIQAESLGLLAGGYVLFTGSLSQPDLIQALHAHRIMVVPSRMEPMGMVIAEGLAAGCTLIVARQGGMPEVGGEFCRYFTANDAASLAMAIQGELRHPTVPEPTMVKKHLEQFSIGYSVDRLEEWLGGNSKSQRV